MSIANKTYKTEGVVLKRINYGETDRIVTLFTKQYGKVSCLAKGVRRLKSTKRSSLEPGTRAYFFFAKGKSLDILTQAKLINSYGQSLKDLKSVTQVYQILEIIDKLTVEHQEIPDVYAQLLEMLGRINTQTSSKSYVLSTLRQLLQNLGFTHDKEFSEFGLKNYIEDLAGRPLRAKAFLTLPIQNID